MRIVSARALLLILATFGCQATSPNRVSGPGTASEPDRAAVEAEIRAALDELYRAFCFDAGGEADWEAMRALFLDGAAFVAPIGPDDSPKAVREHEFVSDFRAFVRTSPLGGTGFHERITNLRIDVFGKISHAYVTFEGFVPGEEAARTRGVDSIQLVRDGDAWRVVSFTTQYETAETPLPARFRPD